MCDPKCEHPERLNSREPSECSEEQIKKCHGEEALEDEHSCE
ncbi:MAG: hypothetical protein ACQEP9_09980 [Bacillota bacterium]